MRSLFRKNENEHVGEPIDYFKEYKIKIFRAVPPNVALICKNIFTGKPFVKNSGLAILAPWVESKYVSLAQNTRDYPKIKYKTLDGIEVNVDIAITFAIVDPIKYEFNNNDIFQQLGIITQDMLREFIASKNVDELIGGKHNMSSFDTTNEYVSFGDSNGIRISNVYFKSINLPQSMIDDYEKKKSQEMENKRLLEEAQARRERALIDAETQKILGEVANKLKADELEQILKIFEDDKLTSIQKLDLVKSKILSSSNANLFYNMNENSDSNMVKYVIAKKDNALGSQDTVKVPKRIRKSGR